jgi:LuxR family transcriptional regulator, maltose regulon positive regulatory protein
MGRGLLAWASSIQKRASLPSAVIPRGAREWYSHGLTRAENVAAIYCSRIAEIVSSDERLREGEAALARGAWAEARAIFERELEARETVDALEGLSWAAWWVEDVPVCLEARERAYRLSRREGDMRRAAMLALWVADDYLILRGERAIANGWFQRAARILDGLDTCPEHGWLDSLLGYVATIDGDPERAKALALRARELGRELAVVSLEMFALAVEGLALVNEGEVADGMRCLDEATAAALAGEYEEIVPAGWTFCFLLNACERVRDYERAAEWCSKVEEFSRRMRTNFVTLACRAHYGAVLTWQGRWDDAERSLREASGHLAAERPSWSGLAIVRLADLRRRQGRFAEAEELLQRAAGNALAPVAMAELALDRGDARTAGDLLEPMLRRVPAQTPTLRAAPLEVMVRAKAAAGEAEAANAHLTELRSIAHAVGTGPLRASLSLCEGLVAEAAGDQEKAREGLEDAVELFAASGASFELARTRLELARVHASLGRQESAVREATLALRHLDEIGATAEAARARELLGSLGAPAKAHTPSRDQLLTPRELEVLRLVSEGLTDGEIATRLVLSRHTVHRHVQKVYARLGCSSRAAAVAKANQLGLL